jgi:hypothetical protein
MNQAQTNLLGRLLAVAATACVQHPLATSSELWLKVVLCEWLLANAFTILEPRTGKGKKVSAATLRDGVLTVEKVNRPPCPGSVDLRVHNPQMHLELKVRAKFGASEQARHKAYCKDLDNVVSGKATAFLFAADLEPYKRFTKEATTKKPRKTLESVLPPAAVVTTPTVTQCLGTWGNTNTIARACRVRCTNTGEERIIVAVCLQ